MWNYKTEILKQKYSSRIKGKTTIRNRILGDKTRSYKKIASYFFGRRKNISLKAIPTKIITRKIRIILKISKCDYAIIK